MKKSLLILSAILIAAFTLNAQITITSNNLPVVGKAIVTAEDTVLTGLTVGSAGANQTWNFANWVGHKQRTEWTVNPSTLTGASNFPNANIATVKDDGQASFINVTSTSLDILGFYGNMAGTGIITMKINPYLRYISLPSTYNTTFNGNYQVVVAMAYPPNPNNIDSIKMIRDVTYTSIFDGWGTITTPAHANVQCIRQKYKETSLMNSYIHMNSIWIPAGNPETDSSTAYRWWSDSYALTLAEVETDGLGNIESASYNVSYQNGVPDAISENQSANYVINVYPNPVKNIVNISGTNEASTIIISDVCGKTINTVLSNGINNIDVADYKNGIYFYQIIDLKGNTLKRGKFIVEK